MTLRPSCRPWRSKAGPWPWWFATLDLSLKRGSDGTAACHDHRLHHAWCRNATLLFCSAMPHSWEFTMTNTVISIGVVPDILDSRWYSCLLWVPSWSWLWSPSPNYRALLHEWLLVMLPAMIGIVDSQISGQYWPDVNTVIMAGSTTSSHSCRKAR